MFQKTHPACRDDSFSYFISRFGHTYHIGRKKGCYDRYGHNDRVKEIILPGLQGQIISLVLILLLISPMLRAIMMKKNHSVEYQQLWHDSKYNRGPLVSLIVLRIILCIGLVMLPIARLLNTAVGIGLAIAATVIALVIFSKRLKKQSILMERHFFTNLTARELENERNAPINQRFASHLLERDLHLADFEVKQNSPSMGKTLKELNFRQKCNVNIVTIIRGSKRINIPGGNERLYPFDKLVVVGADDDLAHFRQYIEERYKESLNNLQETKEVNMEQFFISEGSGLIGRTILESGIRLFIHTLYHGPAGHVGQRFPREAGGGISCRYYSYKLHTPVVFIR